MASLAQHPLADPDDLPRFLQYRNEFLRADQLPVMLPAQQRFHPHQIRPPVLEAADGLVMQYVLVARHRLGQRAFQVQPALRAAA